MKRRLSCQAVYAEQADSIAPCPSCRTFVPLHDDIPVYAPAHAEESEGFKADYLQELVQLEQRNFWK